ncbi:MAG: GtrA family protein [Rhodoferax sp.]|uniref:GtrA family protein n=2 Tax=Rhodoferax sp. TaxID=50421 RepID=UPI003263EFB2
MKPSPQFLRFCMVGIVGLGVDLAVLYATAWALGWYGARVLSFTAAATATWWLNRRYTFQAADNTSVWTQYSRYMVSMLGGAVLNYTAYVATLHWVDLPGKAALGVALGSCAGLLSNYLTARHLVFKNQS